MLRGFAVTLLVVSSLLVATSASAESGDGFHQLRARVGDFLFVSDPDRGVEISGHLTSVSDHELTINGYRFVPKPGLKVERAGDTIWDGAALGFLAGGVAGVTVGAEGCLNRSMTPCFLGNGLMFGALGAYWDWRTWDGPSCSSADRRDRRRPELRTRSPCLHPPSRRHSISAHWS